MEPSPARVLSLNREIFSYVPTDRHLHANYKLALARNIAGLPWWLSGEESACNPGDQVWSPGWEGPLEKEMATHPVFLPEEPHGQRSLAGYSPWDCKELDMAEWLTLSRALPVTEQRGRLPSAPWRSKPVLLRLLNLQRHLKESGCSETICAPWDLMGQVFRWLDIFRNRFHDPNLCISSI